MIGIPPKGHRGQRPNVLVADAFPLRGIHPSLIATLGLLSDSPAVVIGAMLVAPWIMPLRAASFAILHGLLLKLFADRQLSVAPEVPAYLVPRIERTFAAAARFVDALDRAALAENRPVTVHLARTVVAALAEVAEEREPADAPSD